LLDIIRIYSVRNNLKDGTGMTRILIASDIHGSREYCEKLINIFRKENVEEMVVLGDVYYHGVRNALPIGYEPKSVALMLNAIRDRLTVVRGNCDSEVDLMVSDFPYYDCVKMFVGGKRIYLAHGHKFTSKNRPWIGCDVVISGHTHVCGIREEDGVIFANPGSVSMPKENTPNSYMILTEKGIELKNIDGEVISAIAF